MFHRESRLQKPVKTEELTTLLFIFLSAAAMILAFGRAFSSRGDSIQQSLFWNFAYSDHFMDLFNPLRETRDLSWVYQRNIIYPPLSVLLTHLLTKLFPWEALNITFRERYSLQLNAMADTIWLVLEFFSVLLFAFGINRYLRRAKLSGLRYVSLFFLCVNFPMVYCLERGNLSLMALAFCAVFVFFRNDENKRIRELSYICLALGAGLKLFPAALGVLLLYDRKFKAAARTVLYGIAAVVLPYLIILLLTPKEGGIAQTIASKSSAMISAQAPAAGRTVLSLLTENADPNGSIFRFIANLFSRIEKTRDFTFNSTSFSNIVYFLASQDVISPETARIAGMAVFCITEAIAAVLGFFCKREWQRVYLAVFLMLNIHSIAMHYTLIYLLLPLTVFLAQTAKEDRRRINITYVLLFCVHFIFLPFYTDSIIPTMKAIFLFYLVVERPTNFNKLLSSPVFYIMTIMIAIDVIKSVVSARRAKKAAQAAAADTAAAMPENADRPEEASVPAV